MTFAAVGTIISVQATTFSLTPGGIGDFILFSAGNNTSSAVIATGMSSSNVTWVSLGGSATGATADWTGLTFQAFLGTVTSTSTQTVTTTWSGTTPGAINSAGQEFSSTAGAASVTLDVQATLDNSSGTNANWPSLSPDHGAGELYYGFCLDISSATNGSTSGYTYQQDGHGNGLAYDLSSPNTATFPVWGDNGQGFGIVLLAYEASATNPGPPLNQGLLPNFPAVITSNAGWRNAGHSR